jgi:hypothetical protein
MTRPQRIPRISDLTIEISERAIAVQYHPDRRER